MLTGVALAATRLPVLGRVATGAPPSEAEFSWLEATVAQLQAAMERGELTAVALTQAYLARIAQLDRAGPKLNAIIEVNPDALELAVQADRERAAGRIRGPLHGIPVLIKDNIDSADRMRTTAGSLALLGSKPRQDATVVARLRAGGAVLLGKTNLSEWANFRSTRSISGWSGRGGQTRNPYALDRNPSGSSSGSAAAVAASFCAVAVGTETDGSIVSPASVCGLVGLKPTVGLVSRAGIIPISASQDTAGPMARTVRDAALLLGVMAGDDVRDGVTQTRPADVPRDYTQGLDAPALSGARLGVVRAAMDLNPKTEAVLAAAVAALRAAGAEVVDPVEIAGMKELNNAEFEVLLYEFKDGLNAYFASLGSEAPIKSLAELISFNAAHATEEMPYFRQELLEQAQAKGPLTDKAYVDALATCRRLARVEGIDAVLAQHRLDALVTLTNGPAWLIDPVSGDSYTGGTSTLAAVAGYPSVTVPAGQIMGLPVGLLFTGAAWSELKLLQLAADFERRVAARVPPQFQPTVKW
ncbi:MAG: amidase [Opitutaceae bacterium]|nr:amidase [Opitutaceae bacterium]